MAPPTKPLKDFTLAVVCPLEIEALSMIRQLDEDKHYGSVFSDDCHFRLGGIGTHNIVITSLPGGRQGHSSAAVAAQQTKVKFQNINYFLLVGIAGGVPSDKNDIRLGDVVISFPAGKYGGVVQYDFGKEEEKFKHNGQLKSVPQTLVAYLDSIKLTHGFYAKETPKYIQYLNAQIAAGRLVKPDGTTDRLFPATYSHQGGSDCTSCDERQAQVREVREQPRVHYGLIASGNRVMKNGQQRDQYNQDHGGIVLAYEMEAAGLMNFTPCLVIRGISDYSDSHKPPGKMWHAFAAAAAASFAREFIEEVPVEAMKTLSGGSIMEREPQWNIPFGRNKDFIGREFELDDLIARLDLENEDDCRRVAISGLGGIGKTQLALEAAFKIKERLPDYSIFWVPAINITTFDRAYRDIGQKLKIPGINDDKSDVKSLVKASLSQESSGRWLIIIDNADDAEMLFDRASENGSDALALVDYLPFSRRGSILLTTRNSKVAVRYAESNSMTLRDMTKEESQELFTKSLVDKSLTRDKEAVLDLLNLLSNLPLAIKQAAAFINENSTSVAEYVGIYHSGSEDLIELLSESFEDNGRYQSLKNPIALTWLISFEQIERSDRLAAEYLYFMSCVGQQNIPHSLLPPASKFKEVKSIGTLKAYAFITERTGHKSYDIHRLVQLAVKNWLKNEKHLSSWSLKTLERVAEVFPFFEHDKRDECTLLFPHTQYVLEFQRLSGESGEPSRKLLDKVGMYFWLTGKSREAELIHRQALELKKKVLSLKHPSTCDSIENLGSALRGQGKYEEAEAMHREALELKEEVLGPEHLDTLQSMNSVAIALNVQGKLEEAEAMHKKTADLQEKVLGFEHPHRLRSLNNQAVALGKQGKEKEAEAIHRQNLKLREKLLGLQHPDTLQTMNNLAASLDHQGRYEEAKPIHEQTLKLKQAVLGLEHPDTMNSMNNIAMGLYDQGKYKEAEVLHRQVLEIREKVLGPENPGTLDSVDNLANVLRHQGKSEEAEILHRQALEIREKVLGPQHPETLDSINNLSLALCSQKRFEEAEILLRQALEIREKVLGPEHPDTLESIDSLGLALYNQGRFKEAEILHRQALKIREKVLGPRHPITLDSIENLGSALCSQRKYNEAESMHRQALALKENVIGPEHPHTLDSIDSLGVVLYNQGNYEEAETLHRQALKIKMKVLGSRHPGTLKSIDNLANVLRHRGECEEAETIPESEIQASNVRCSEDFSEDDKFTPLVSPLLTPSSRPPTPPAPNPKPVRLRISQGPPPPKKPSKPSHLQEAARVD